MPKIFLSFLLISILISGFAQKKQRLVWSDEFNYNGAPDPKKWGYDTGGNGWGNNELQYYTLKKQKNARVENGYLIIEAHHEPVGNKNYTSARLVTKGKGDWSSGRIEVRAKLPRGLGTWPAIWMLGSKTPLVWPDDGEIDIMEHVGYDQGNIHASAHCKKYNHIIGTQKTDTIRVNDCSEAFHIYQVDWDSETIRIGVDNNYYFIYKNEHSDRTAWPFSEPFYLILNIAVGGNWGGQKGVDNSIYPLRMEVDYVRVYQ